MNSFEKSKNLQHNLMRPMTTIDVVRAYWAAYRQKARLLRYSTVNYLASKMLTYAVYNTVYLWPPFNIETDRETLTSFLGRLKHYLKGLSIGVEYYVHSQRGLERHCKAHSEAVTEHIGFVDEEEIQQYLKTVRYCLLWFVQKQPRLISIRPSLYFVDDTHYSYGSVEWIRLTSDIYHSTTSANHVRPLPPPSQPIESCAVLGSGPSVEYFLSEANERRAWVAANFVATDERIWHTGVPYAICILDSNIFAPLESMRPLWNAIFALLRNTPAILVTTLEYAAFIELYLPQDIQKKTFYARRIGQDVFSISTRFDLKQLVVATYGNVLTDLMLPIATAISNQITLFGCDGKPPDDDPNQAFPKSALLQQYDSNIHNEVQWTDIRSFYRTYFDINSLYTRYVVDECSRHGARLCLRSPSWNRGLQHLPVIH